MGREIRKNWLGILSFPKCVPQLQSLACCVFSGLCTPADSEAGEENKLGVTFLQSWRYLPPKLALSFSGQRDVFHLSAQWSAGLVWPVQMATNGRSWAGPYKLFICTTDLFFTETVVYFCPLCINQTAQRSACLVTVESAMQIQIFSFSHKCHSLIRLACVYVSGTPKYPLAGGHHFLNSSQRWRYSLQRISFWGRFGFLVWSSSFTRILSWHKPTLLPKEIQPFPWFSTAVFCSSAETWIGKFLQ